MSGKGLVKYHILGTLWVGQCSIVYRATNAAGQTVAIKMLLPDSRNRSMIRAMEREASISLSLDHPNVIHTLEFTKDSPMPALVMEYFECENLKTHIQRGEQFIHQYAHAIITQVCQALAYIHGLGLIHRDMKPENVLVAKDGLTKIIDFALSEWVGKRRFSFGRRPIAGTRPYIAPETIQRKPSDPRTDIYSLGITIYEMLTGRPPFVSTDRNELLRKHLAQQPTYMRTYRKNIAAKMDDLVLQMLAKSPDDRPQSADDIIRRMKDIQVFDD